MTYGWAILIIVIVAVILYSMGIFNPSSAITASITGFSSLGSVTAQVVPNSGLVLLLGDNSGYDINITNITISMNGKTSTVNPNTLISTTSSSKFFIPFSSIPASSSYSFTVIVHYTEPGQPLPGPYISTGKVFGTSTSSSGFYQLITITNSQTTPTPAPFQQMINLSISYGGWYSVTGMIASNFQNVEFFSSNGLAVPSWLENYSSSQFIYWVKLQNGIPASSSVKVYMVFFPKSYNVLNNVNDGEAPQIPCIEEGITNASKCSVYAEYDDGANVFNNYWNFAGTAVPSSMTSSGTVTVDNGVTVSFGGYLTTTTTFTYPSNIIADFGFTAPTANAGDAWYQFGYVSQSGGFTYDSSTAIAWNTYDSPPYFVSESGAGGSSDFIVHTNFLSGTAPTGSFNVGSVYWGSPSSDSGWINYGNEITQTTNIPSSALYLGINNNQGDGTAPPVPTLYWLRTRAYPPNGVMPSVSFGSIA